MGLVFIIIGNYLPKCKQNYTVGIKLPWTLNSEENWNKTHRLAGYVFMLCGIMQIVDVYKRQVHFKCACREKGFRKRISLRSFQRAHLYRNTASDKHTHKFSKLYNFQISHTYSFASFNICHRGNLRSELKKIKTG